MFIYSTSVEKLISLLLFLLQAPCRAELQRALDRLASNTRTHDDLFTIPIPNCDKNGDFHTKQVCAFKHTLMMRVTELFEHYLAVCNAELWIFIIKPIQIKMPIFILQTVPFQLHQQYLVQNTKHACSWWNFVLLVQDQHKSVSKQTLLREHANAKTLVFQAHIKKVIYFHKSRVELCV